MFYKYRTPLNLIPFITLRYFGLDINRHRLTAQVQIKILSGERDKHSASLWATIKKKYSSAIKISATVP